MPLEKSASKEAFENNVSEMINSGHPQKQALAAAYSNQRRYQSNGALTNLNKHRKK